MPLLRFDILVLLMWMGLVSSSLVHLLGSGGGPCLSSETKFAARCR